MIPTIFVSCCDVICDFFLFHFVFFWFYSLAAEFGNVSGFLCACFFFGLLLSTLCTFCAVMQL
jgi:hypothetical protein